MLVKKKRIERLRQQTFYTLHRGYAIPTLCIF